MSAEALLAFALASLVLALTPGPGVLYIVARTLSQGRRAGFASVAGVALGNGVNAALASLGLAALLAVSPLAFTLLKLAGAAYLAWLGIRALRDGAAPAAGQPGLDAADLRRTFRDAVLVAALNPKTALFFAAFLPQFLDVQQASVGTSLALGLGFVAIAALSDSGYVLAASLLPMRRLAGAGAARWGRRASAVVYLGLSVYALLSGPRLAAGRA